MLTSAPASPPPSDQNATRAPRGDRLAPDAPPRLADPRGLSRRFLRRLAELDEGTPAHAAVRNTLVELNLPLVRREAARFRCRPEEREDLVQVGTIGLIKAIDRFDPSRDVEFTTFAVPCVRGEIKRFFRDTGWAVHVPRRLQELRQDLSRGREELGQLLGRSPTTAELAGHLGRAEREVAEGLVASNGYSAASLDGPEAHPDGPGGAAVAERLGRADPALEAAENVHALKPLLARLDLRERDLLRMRFGAEMTQTEIAEELGVSQMHVSRLLNRALAALRQGFLGER